MGNGDLEVPVACYAS